MTNETKTQSAENASQESAHAAPESGAGERIRRVNWDDSRMETSFANVVNVLNTREEFMMLFGTNQTWNAVEAEELNVRLDHRIVLTPHATKRLMTLLQNRINDYEKRFGKIDL
ncbi:DUF3467 domain-containing protein [Ferruginivarius sediminum]|nr:DUF3467 domain-containing protein [Ferruginivarius sediminum]